MWVRAAVSGNHSPKIGQVELGHANEGSAGAPPQLLLLLDVVLIASSSISSELGLLNDGNLSLEDGESVGEVSERFLGRGKLSEVEVRGGRGIR